MAKKRIFVKRTVFPGDSAIKRDNTFIDMKRVKDALAMEGNNYIDVILIGCIDYLFYNQHHQTGFMYRLTKSNNIHSKSGIGIDPNNGNVAQEYLGLMPSFGEGNYID